MSDTPPPPPQPGSSPEPPPNDARPSQPPQYGEADAATPHADPVGAGPGGAPGTTHGEPANIGIRFGARVIDAILLTIVFFIVALPFGGAMAGGGSPMGSMGMSGTGFLLGLISTAIGIAYFTFLEQSRGQTVGKMLLNLRTVGPSGANPTTEEAFKRNAWYLLGIIPVIGGLAGLVAAIAIAVTASGKPDKRGWHDNFAGGTQVLRTS